MILESKPIQHTIYFKENSFLCVSNGYGPFHRAILYHIYCHGGQSDNNTALWDGVGAH